ncbi:unnamed protein product, partial [Staurois parvus]
GSLLCWETRACHQLQGGGCAHVLGGLGLRSASVRPRPLGAGRNPRRWRSSAGGGCAEWPLPPPARQGGSRVSSAGGVSRGSPSPPPARRRGGRLRVGAGSSADRLSVREGARRGRRSAAAAGLSPDAAGGPPGQSG